jgi:hypothetical protein
MFYVQLADAFNIKVFKSFQEVLDEAQSKYKNNVIFDVATPPDAFHEYLEKCPPNSKVPYSSFAFIVLQ